MTLPDARERISVIVPTIGRPMSLRRMLDSVAAQSFAVEEVVIADSSRDADTAAVAGDPAWARAGMKVIRVPVQPPNAVGQRRAAIAASTGDHLLLLDDDIALHSGCLEAMVHLMRQDAGTAAVVADVGNHDWPMPTRAWRLYLRHILGLEDGDWQGRVLGPLLRFGFNPRPAGPVPIEWLSTAQTLLRRSAYFEAGGFSDFFLRRCTMNEDVDLGLKVARVGNILFCPAARMDHHHAPGGRVSTMVAAEDDLFNRYSVMRHTQRRPAAAALGLTALFFAIETASNVGGAVIRLRSNGLAARTFGRVRALGRILIPGGAPR
jgi:GT2 family glycosyltransferase